MTLQIGLLLGVLLFTLILFSREWFSPDVVGLCVLLVLVFLGLLPAKDAFAGFGSDTVILILGLLLLTAALLRTGVVEMVGGVILRYTGHSFDRLLLIVMLASATLGAFMSNTACTAFFLPIVLGIAARAKVSPSKLLLPLAFSSILTSSVTLISTSTNVVVSGMITRYAMPPMGMFELAPVGLPILAVGLLYLWVVTRFWLPDRISESRPSPMEQFGVSAYLTEVLIRPGSYLIGKTLPESGLGRDLDLTVLSVLRDKHNYYAPSFEMKLRAGDVLLVEGIPDEIVKIKDKAGIDIKPDVKLSDPTVQGKDIGLVEAILLPKSPLIGTTLKTHRFRERYGLQVLGINRLGKTVVQKMSEVPLRMGDTLLVQGPVERLKALEGDATLRIIGSVAPMRPHRKKAPLAVGIFVGVLALATFKVLSLPVAVILGAALVFITRCITSEEAYREVEWKAIILIGSMLGLGAAMDHTGAAKYLASLIVQSTSDMGPRFLLSGFFVLTILLTQPMSNQAAAIVVLPVAIQTALQLGLNPRTFAMMVAVGASCSFLTPLEPSCLMVYGPGRYRFADFLKFGSVLTVLIYIIAIILVPRVWPVR